MIGIGVQRVERNNLEQILWLNYSTRVEGGLGVPLSHRGIDLYTSALQNQNTVPAFLKSN